MAHDVFISYSSHDQATALAVVNALESKGVRCWMAPRDVRAGDVWAQVIVEAIAASRVLVLVFSASANRSGHVVNEVDAAIRKGAIVVPFRIENVMPDGAMEFHLRTRHWLDALTPDLGHHIAELVTTIKSVLGAPASQAPQTEFGVPVAKKSGPRVESTESGFHLKLPKPHLPKWSKVRTYVVGGVAVVVALLLISRVIGRSGSILKPFEVREIGRAHV